MNKKKIIMIVLIAAAAAMMWVKLAPWFLPRRGRGRTRVAAVAPAAAVPAAVAAVAPAAAVPAVTPVPVQKAPEGNLARLEREFDLDLWCRPGVYDKELKNPFIMRIRAEEPLLNILVLDLSLEGVIWAADNPLAIIDGKVYSIGEALMEGLWIKAIKIDHIIATDGEKEKKFTLNRKDGL